MAINANFLTAAKRPGSVPVILVAVESLTQGKRVLTTHSDWNASPVLPAALSVVSKPGSVELTGASPATMTTNYLDFLAPPAAGARFEVDDVAPAGSSIIYTAYGSNNLSAWNSLGVVVDGDTLPPYRAYRFVALFACAGTDRPLLQEIRLVDTATAYTYFSTVKDCPVDGAKPYVKARGISELSSRVELTKMTSVGEVSINLHFSRFVSDFLSTGQMRGKAVVIKIGYVGLAESEFQPYFAGTLHDWTFSHDKQTVNIKTRDVWRKLSRNIPDESYFLDGTGKKDDTKVFTISGHAIDCILQIIDYLGIADRFIDRSTMTALKTQMPGPEYNITSRLASSESADDLIGKIATSFGLYLYSTETGQLTARLYDSIVSAPPSATIDARRLTCSDISAGQRDLVTRVAVYYALCAGKEGGNRDDYNRCYYYVDSASEAAWQESQDKEWLDKFAMSGPAIERLAQRLIKWYATPRKTFKVDNVPPRFYDLTMGTMIAIDYLQLPAPATQWPGYSSAKTFIITGRSINPDTLYLSWELQEADPLNYSYQGLPTYSSSDIFPAVTELTAVERISRRTDGTIDTLVDLSWFMDFRFSAVTLLVNEASTGWRPVVNIPAQSGSGFYSYPVRDGIPYVFGVQTVNSAGAVMPFAVMPVVSITPIGKSAPPANVGAVILTPRGEFLEIVWPHIADADLAGYTVRLGTVWATALEIVTGYGGNVFLWKPIQAGTINIMVKALDTSKLESGQAATASLVITGQGAPILTASVLDNQVVLSWLPGTAGVFPVNDYEIRRGASWTAGVLIGSTAGTVQSVFETVAGSYTYWVAARDVSGTGAAASVIVAVSSPPDYIFKGSKSLLFTGTKINAIIDNNCIVLPVNATESVDAHFTRVGQTTPQGQISAGYPLYIQPGIASGSYSETFDFGITFTTSKVTADISQSVLAGAVSVSTVISTSANGSTWTDYNGLSCYGSNFRYVKLTVTATTANGGVLVISGGAIRLDVRMKTMEGVATAAAADSGGTTVYITDNRASNGAAFFLDVESIQVTPKATIAVMASYDFTDSISPTSFKVLLFQQSNGARYSGDFSYIVRGV